jgi:hypothetical protein
LAGFTPIEETLGVFFCLTLGTITGRTSISLGADMPKQSSFTSTNPKMGGIPQYKKGGVVKGPNPNIDDATRARARAQQYVANNAAPTRNKVVTKEELTKSGLSLRDYMNKQQGLTRRKEVNPTLGGNNQAEVDAADKVDYAQVLQLRETGNTRGGPSYDSAGKPSNAGPDVLSSNYSRNTRTGAPVRKESSMSKEDYMKSREQYKRAQDEAPMQTFEKGGLVKAGAGAGRGGQGGPTAKQLDDYERKQNAGIFTAGMRVPKNDDMGSMRKK